MDNRVSLDSLPDHPKACLRGEVLHLFLRTGETLICAYSKDESCGGVVGLSTPTALSTAKAILTLVSGLTIHGVGEDKLVFKLVGPDAGLRLVRQFLFDRHMTFVSDFETTADRTEIFFYTGNGRLRVSSQSGGVAAAGKRRVLIVDDSITIRRLLRRILSEHPQIEVVGEAERPSMVLDLIEKLRPDVMTLDIHMPEMDGVTLLRKVMTRCPLPVVMVSSVSYEEGVQVLRAIEFGAVDYVEKPKADDLDEIAGQIVHKVLAAVQANIRPPNEKPVDRSSRTIPLSTANPIIIGASTGGTEAIKEILIRLPKEIPPIVIAQHIPAGYSRAFAERLNDLCAFPVKEAQNGEPILSGTALVAPGGFQTAIRQLERGFVLEVGKSLYPSCYEPCVDLLFESAAETFGRRALGVILTGMGSDGAHGLLKLRQQGAHTVAQNQESCVVFGMPRVAIEMGAAELISPIEGIAGNLIYWLSHIRKAA